MGDAGAVARGRIAGLDGLRGLAVALVVVFHAWPASLPGGFLGVTLFFSLSGYLITSILIRELAATGTVALRRFWWRRCRRLLPASLATLLAIAVVWGLAGWLTGEVRHDLAAGALEVANWSQIAARHPYGASGDTSPVLHFWSLAIEEQFYWVFPMVAVLAGSVRRFTVALVALLTLSVIATVVWSGDSVVVYSSTATRAAEVLAGALVAIAVSRRRPTGAVAHVAGVVGLIGVGALVALSRLTSLDTSIYYEGGLVVAGLVAAVTVGAIAQSPWLGRVLDVAPLAWLGARSYGIYLFHWPLIVGLRAAGTPAAPAVAVVATLVLAAASARWFEAPFRSSVPLRRRFDLMRVSAVGIPVTVALIAVAVIAPVDTPPSGAIDFDRAATLAVAELQPVSLERSVTGVEPSSSAVPSPSSPSATNLPTASPTIGAGPVTYGFVGDSKALTLGIGAQSLVDDRIAQVPLFSKLGCPIGRGGRSRVAARDGQGADTGTDCDWSTYLAAALQATGPVGVAVVYSGTWDARERQVPVLGDGWWTIDDPAYADWLYGEMAAMTRLLVDGGVGRVAWMTAPVDPNEEHANRIVLFDALVQRLAAEHPDTVSVIDLASWLSNQSDANMLLPDGAHTTFAPDGGTSVPLMQRFLADQILAAAR